MCGRFFIDIDELSLREIVEAAQRRLDEGALKTGEIFPTDTTAVLAGGRSGMVAMPMKWGFPRWDGKGVIINARQETAAQKKTFSGSLQQRRIAVPASGFFEWNKNENGKDKYLFTYNTREPLFMAGMYNTFDGVNCFNILTTNANDAMEPYHHRMPVLMRRDELREWLKGDYHGILARVPSNELEASLQADA